MLSRSVMTPLILPIHRDYDQLKMIGMKSFNFIILKLVTTCKRIK